MAQSIFQKVQTLISSSLHTIVDEALDSNSIAVLDEYIRQAEQDLDELEQALITVKSQVKTLKRKYQSLQQEVDEWDARIDTLLMRGDDDLAIAAQSEYNAKLDLAQEFRQQFLQHKSEADKLAEARLKLEARLRSIRREREHVRGLLELARTKEITARSMKSLSDLEGVGDADVAGVADKIRRRLDRADAEVEMRTERLGSRIDDIMETTRLENQLEERRRRLTERERDKKAQQAAQDEQDEADMLRKSDS